MIENSTRSKVLVLFVITSILILAACSEREAPRGTENLTAEQTELVRYYQQIKQAGLEGQTRLVMSQRDSVTSDFIRRLFDLRQVPIDSAAVFSWASTWPDVAGLPLAQDTIAGEWRRMLFVVDSIFDKENREKIMFPMLMFRLENNEWKFANASRYSTFKYKPDGEVIQLSDLSFHKMFQLPPEFPDLDSLANAAPPQPHEIPDSIKAKMKNLPEPKRGQ